MPTYLETKRDTAERHTPLRRRGLIAGAAALAAGLLAARADPAAAASGTGPDGNFVIGSKDGGANTATRRTDLVPTNAATFNDTSVLSVSAFGATATVDGVRGFAGGNGNGVTGFSATDAGVGVVGAATTLNAVGVLGFSDRGDGLYGQSNSGFGARATSSTGVGVDAFTVSGVGMNAKSSSGVAAYAESGSGVGVFAKSATNAGIHGESAQSYGVYGVNTGGGAFPTGVYGVATAAGGNGVVGTANVANGKAVAGYASGTGAYAGAFYGTVLVQGQLIVQGGPKNAAVPFADGSHRLFYCIESPESWFEDFGEGTLLGGGANVPLDPEFLSAVDTATLRIFLTPQGNYALYVAGRTATGFAAAVVSGTGAGAGGTGTFTYRAVARRKDIVTGRLARVEIEPNRAVPPLAPAVVPPRVAPGRRPDGAAIAASAGAARPVPAPPIRAAAGPEPPAAPPVAPAPPRR